MSGPFIFRPIATTLMMVGMVLLGVIGFRALPSAALPTVDFPTIQVVAQYPGASPQVVETALTAPLEHYFGQLSSLKSMSSTSSYGICQITLQFDLGRKIDAAALDVQSAINAAAGWVPTALLPGPPTYRKVNPADAPVLILALTSDVLTLHEVSDYAQTVVTQKLSQVSGVGAVAIEGGQRKAIRLRVNPAQLAGYGISLEDVRRAVAASTVNSPKGDLDGTTQQFQIGANDQLFVPAGYDGVIVAYRNNAPVRLRDIGRAENASEDAELAGWYNGKPALILNIHRQPGANAIGVVDAIRDLLPKLYAVLPPSLKISVVTDRTTTIRAAIADLEFTLVLTIALVVLVMFLFLRRFWATVIPSVTLPVSILATFALMALAGFSLDNLSLMALTVAAGFVVDDSIVMIENITRHLEAGESPLQAALKGSRQIGFTVVSLTVSLIAVFIPLLLMGGVVGRLFSQFAITLSLAVLISAFVSLTLTPMMCARLLTVARPDEAPSRAFRWIERSFDTVLVAYVASLDWALKHRRQTLAVAISTLLLTGTLFVVVPKGFLPPQDTGLIVGTTDAAQDISFAEMSRLQQLLADRVAEDPDVKSVVSFVGVGTINPTLNSGRIYIDVGRSEGRPSVARLIQRLGVAARSIDGIALHLQPAQDLVIESSFSRTQYQYVLSGLDEGSLRRYSEDLLAKMRATPELADVASDRQDGGQQIAIIVDRSAAARLGVTIGSINQTLYDAFGQRQIATVYSPLLQYRVVLEMDPRLIKSPDILSKIYVTPTGAQEASDDSISNGVGAGYMQASPAVPLSAVARFERRLAPLMVRHDGLFPSTTLSFNLGQGMSLGQAVAALHRAERRLEIPDAIVAKLSGVAAEFTDSLGNQRTLILAAIVTVYIVLGVLYESFIHPITILSTLPSAGVGALVALLVLDMELDLISLIGLILLIGIVKKNAIMVIDFALMAEREEAMTPHDAIRQACILRFRPIMMTTMAALLAAVPLAFDTGTGAELRRPLGVSIIGGLLVSQALTLYTTPVIYLYFAGGAQWLRKVARRLLAVS